MANSSSAHFPKCRIRYTETGIFFDFQPGCVNFDYWRAKKIQSERLRQTGEGVRLGCEVTKEEAEYIKGLAESQWGPDGCEIIGKPLAGLNGENMEKTEVVTSEVAQEVVPGSEKEQLSLF